MIYICMTCNKKFERRLCDQKSKNTFCSRSCAAKYNNNIYRKVQGSCKICKIPISTSRVYCDKCLQQETQSQWNQLKTITLLEYEAIYQKLGTSKYDKIRYYSRQLMQCDPQICQNCNYNLHVECCHIKPIHIFEKSSTIGEINARNNLILLCRNCHKLLDLGLIKINPS